MNKQTKMKSAQRRLNKLEGLVKQKIPQILFEEELEKLICETFKQLAESLDVRSLEWRLEEEVALEFQGIQEALQFLSSNAPPGPWPITHHLSLNPHKNIEEIRNLMDDVELKQYHYCNPYDELIIQDEWVSYRAKADFLMNDLLLCLHQNKVSTQVLLELIHKKLLSMPDEKHIDYLSKIQRNFQKGRCFHKYESSLSNNFFKTEKRDVLCSNIASYLVIWQPRIVDQVLLEGFERYPDTMDGLASILLWSGRNVKIDDFERRIATSISQTVAIWEKVLKKESNVLASLIKAKTNGRLFQGPEFQRMSAEVQFISQEAALLPINNIIQECQRLLNVVKQEVKEEISSSKSDLEALSQHKALLRKDGEIWHVSFKGKTKPFRSLKGLVYLAHILDASYNGIHIKELLKIVDARFPEQIQTLDKSGYKREKKRIGRNIKYFLNEVLGDELPELCQHLKNSVKPYKGKYTYSPETKIRWKVEY